MATQLDEVSQEVSAQMVGNAFVGQFYSILHENPEVVHNFFQDSSMMTRPGSDGAMTTVTTMKGINDLILSFNCKNYKPQIYTADAHSSHMNGVTVLVTGSMTGHDNVSRKFTETFFLAPQDNGYFVLNNVFRFFDDGSLPVVNQVEKQPDTNVSAEPVTANKGTVEVHDNSFGNHIAIKDTVTESKIEASAPSAASQQKATVVETPVLQAPVESSRSAQAVVEASPRQVVEASSNGHVDASKKSYASLLKGMKDGAAATLARTPTLAAKTATVNTVQTSVTPAGQQSGGVEAMPATGSETSAPNGRNNNTSSADQTGDPGYSVYIGDLPWNATIDLVEQEFKKFGPIKRNGIQVRSNKGYCFGFVEYEDASAQQKAIKMGTIRIDGKEAFIEEKKTTTRVVNGVSTYTGRGGFRNDGGGYRGRGRGNYSNGRGGYNNNNARSEYNNNNNRRNGEVAPRGYYRNGPGSYQNGGRGGPRQVDNNNRNF